MRKENTQRTIMKQKQYISLQNIPKEQPPFSIPENYFENLSSKIANRIEATPTLNSIERKNAFGLPENYFEGLSESIWTKINEQPKMRVSWSAAGITKIAAGVLLVFGLFWLSITKKQLGLEPNELSEVSKQDIKIYLADNVQYDDYSEKINLLQTEVDSMMVSGVEINQYEILDFVDTDALTKDI